MQNLKKAVEGIDYTLNEDGSFNTRKGGRYLQKDGVLYINEPATASAPIPLAESKNNEIQK